LYSTPSSPFKSNSFLFSDVDLDGFMFAHSEIKCLFLLELTRLESSDIVTMSNDGAWIRGPSIPSQTNQSQISSAMPLSGRISQDGQGVTALDLNGDDKLDYIHCGGTSLPNYWHLYMSRGASAGFDWINGNTQEPAFREIVGPALPNKCPNAQNTVWAWGDCGMHPCN